MLMRKASVEPLFDGFDDILRKQTNEELGLQDKSNAKRGNRYTTYVKPANRQVTQQQIEKMIDKKLKDMSISSTTDLEYDVIYARELLNKKMENKLQSEAVTRANVNKRLNEAVNEVTIVQAEAEKRAGKRAVEVANIAKRQITQRELMSVMQNAEKQVWIKAVANYK
tara:strand:+ start:106 stop:609 length:504 start_codon:yes stop_codon:yes gene_type:complete